MNNTIDILITEVTTELTDFLKNYLGKEEFGNIRYGADERFPQWSATSFQWAVVYDNKVKSSTTVGIIYKPRTNTWTNVAEKPYDSKEVALNDFKSRIKASKIE